MKSYSGTWTAPWTALRTAGINFCSRIMGNVHRVCSSEIEVHFLDITAFLYCFFFGLQNEDKRCVGANCSDAEEPWPKRKQQRTAVISR